MKFSRITPMSTKDSRPPPPSSFIVPGVYLEVDMSKSIMGVRGACGLPTPETCGLVADSGRLARYTELFKEAEGLYVPSLLADPVRDFMYEPVEVQEAIVRAWDYLNE